MKKRVLVDLFYLNTALTGIKTYMLEFCEAVQEYPNPDLELIFTHDPKRQSTTTFFRGQIPRWRKLWYHVYYFIWKQFLLPFKARKAKAEIILSFDFVNPVFAGKAKGYTVIHDAFFWQMPHNYSSLWRKYFLKMILLGIKSNSKLITTSYFAQKAILRETPIQNTPAVIYQCPKIYDGPGDAAVLEKLDLKPFQYFFHLGSFDKRKNLPLLVEAFYLFLKDNPGDYKLVLGGEKGLSKSLDDFEQVKAKIAEYELEDRVKLPGFISDAEAKSLYQGAMAYVFPSQNEGFGIPVIEAMHFQTAVIISDQEALMEVAENAALVHQTGNPVDLKDKMEALSRNPELRADLVQKGNQRKEIFSRKAFAKAYYSLMLE
ncbi:glycosyltransferase family 4 protein [Fontibacter flavus]|uniref:Glycosyltransferase family 4 protein n=1 Tax=Fontibacter flavus TaxID=654838 RepID=A0ABV6FRB7_9BACT